MEVQPGIRLRPRYRAYGRRQLNELNQRGMVSRDQVLELEAVTLVLPFRVSNFVLEELIDWDNIPEDPIFQLTFPQPGMLDPKDLLELHDLLVSGADRRQMVACSRGIQSRLNPHPGGQMDLNVPIFEGRRLTGCQHKYRETVLFFPLHGQTCHSYCTYCFRWAQFAGAEHLRFASQDVQSLIAYLREHPEVTDVLLTGGDPMVMKASLLRRYVTPLLDPKLGLTSIRIGTKALAYWPYRFITDTDADDILRLFEDVVGAGRQLALMAHVSHPRELDPEPVRRAIRRIRGSGAVIRCQAPLVHRINDDPAVWSEMWRTQGQLGMVPYYMFVERDTGPKEYFEVPLARALEIFSTAYAAVSGLSRTVRGPVMSATPGKVLVDGVVTIDGAKVFVLKVVQARDPTWANRIVLAHHDSRATWLHGLRPFDNQSRGFLTAFPRQFGPPVHAIHTTHSRRPGDSARPYRGHLPAGNERSRHGDPPEA